MTELMSLLQKVEILQDLKEEESVMGLQPENKKQKTYKTCRYVPLRKNCQKDYTLAEEFTIKEELTENTPLSRKG